MIRPGNLSNASMTSGGDAPSGIGSKANRRELLVVWMTGFELVVCSFVRVR
jgi:hypothetical protein